MVRAFIQPCEDMKIKTDQSLNYNACPALIRMDWAMKFQCQKFRGKQSEWFGKRGLSWHVSSVVLKQTGEPMVVTYTHMFDTCTQDCSFRKPSYDPENGKPITQQGLHKIGRDRLFP